MTERLERRWMPEGRPVGGMEADGSPAVASLMDGGVCRPAFGSLGRRARVWRLGHAAWSVAQLGALGIVWRSGLSGRGGRATWAATGFLGLEGAALVVGRGNCPIGPLQERWGDPVPFFELVLPPRTAKAAIPVLAVASLAGIGLAVARGNAGGLFWRPRTDSNRRRRP